MLRLGLRADGDHAAGRCRQLPRLLARMRPCAQEGRRRRAGCRVLRLRGDPCPLRAAQAALAGQLLPPQHLLRLPPALLLQHLPQILSDWLCAALLLRLLQDALGDVRPRLLPCPRMRLPSLGLPGLGLLGLGLPGRPQRARQRHGPPAAAAAGHCQGWAWRSERSGRRVQSVAASRHLHSLDPAQHTKDIHPDEITATRLVS